MDGHVEFGRLLLDSEAQVGEKTFALIQIEYNFMFVKVFIKPLEKVQFSNVENYRKLFRYKKLVCSLFLLIRLVSKRS